MSPDMPVFLGGNYNQGEGGSLGGSVFSLPSLFADGSPHSNYVCQTPACIKYPETIPPAVQEFQNNPRTPETEGRGFIDPKITHPPAHEPSQAINQYPLNQVPAMANQPSSADLPSTPRLDLENSPLVKQPYQYPEHDIAPHDRPNSQPVDLTLHLVPEGDGQASDQESERREIFLPEIKSEATEDHEGGANE